MIFAKTRQNELIGEEANKGREALQTVNNDDSTVAALRYMMYREWDSHDAALNELGLLFLVPDKVALEIRREKEPFAIYSFDDFRYGSGLWSNHDIFQRIISRFNVFDWITQALDFFFKRLCVLRIEHFCDSRPLVNWARD